MTYEVSPGFTKTMQLILIDVAATERANNEAPGGFFKHTENSSVVTQPAPQASRTLTNRDLMAVRQRRIASEQAYETRRKELGLPTVEETRRRQAEEGAVLREQFREESIAKAREETYWRERAGALRSEIVTVDAEINYLRARLGDLHRSPLFTQSFVTGVFPFVPRIRIWPGPRMMNPGIYGASPAGAATRQPQALAATPWGAPRIAPPGFGFPFGVPFAFPIRPFDYFDYSYERTGLVETLNGLLVTRAGLEARWRELEDEARSEQVPQVWLLP
ncbi:MAG TPA: hypothetical protein VHD88_04195 [Pyrinomonadaceae bacterium]|nr:hypothetical protein [Pyrinomonadaceae bacterium]